LYRRTRALVATDVIASWFLDSPTRVHVFDPAHSLGHFYARQILQPVAESYEDVRAVFSDLQAAGKSKGIPIVLALFPQRFQVRPAEWRATGFEYGLDLEGFDARRPNRILMQACRDVVIDCTDLLPGFAEDGSDLYQPRGDMHWNDRGHALAGRLLAGEIGKRFLGSSNSAP
jgi:hypothetical protein